MRTKEEILKDKVQDIYLFTNGTLEKREQFKNAILEAMEAYASQFSGSEPEGKTDDSWKQKFSDWLINNIHLTSKSNVELIIDHIERYYYKPQSVEPEGKEAVEFAEYIGNQDLKLYSEGWCQPGGSNGFYYSTIDLYNNFKIWKAEAAK